MTQGMATSSFKNKLFISVNYVEGKIKTDYNSYLKALIMAIKQAYFQKYQYFTNFVAFSFYKTIKAGLSLRFQVAG